MNSAWIVLFIDFFGIPMSKFTIKGLRLFDASSSPTKLNNPKNFTRKKYLFGRECRDKKMKMGHMKCLLSTSSCMIWIKRKKLMIITSWGHRWFLQDKMIPTRDISSLTSYPKSLLRFRMFCQKCLGSWCPRYLMFSRNSVLHSFYSWICILFNKHAAQF